MIYITATILWIAPAYWSFNAILWWLQYFRNGIICVLQIAIEYGSGQEGVAVLLPGFAIKW